MKITHLGQAGLLLETDGKTVMVDPYLSDSVERFEPWNKRRIPVEKRFLAMLPDCLVLTHNHLDHTDPDTLAVFLGQSQKKLTVLAPFSAWQEVKKYGNGHNYILFNRHTQWTEGAVRFTAVKAEHSDPSAIGVLIEAEGKTYYITGDTLYNTDIFADIPKKVDAVFLPVNGVGNNMNLTDAKRFCEAIQPKVAVPMHWGLFDDVDPHRFDFPHRVIPTYYQEINLEEES